MKKLWNRIINDKILLTLFIAMCIVVLFDLLVVIFDIVQIVKVSGNRPALSNLFLPINIIMAGVNLLLVIAGFLYAFLRKK